MSNRKTLVGLVIVIVVVMPAISIAVFSVTSYIVGRKHLPVEVQIRSLADCSKLVVPRNTSGSESPYLRIVLDGCVSVDLHIGSTDVRMSKNVVESAFVASQPMSIVQVYEVIQQLSFHPGANSRLRDTKTRMGTGELRLCDVGGYQLLGVIKGEYSLRVSCRCFGKSSGTVIVELHFEK